LRKKTISQGNNEFSHGRAQVPWGETHLLYLGKSPSSLMKNTSLSPWGRAKVPQGELHLPHGPMYF